MKREIKFRAWDNFDKKWLLGYEYPNLGGFSMFGECMLFNEWSGIINRFILQQKDRIPDDLILMQYTGLKDKNGKEIYEGDIFQRHNGHTSEVAYDNYHACFGLKDKGLTHLNGIDNSNGEIIGNIYENPELI